ncbi:hypothetical protein MY10362_003565 [Beauveria mimosiformis]
MTKVLINGDENGRRGSEPRIFASRALTNGYPAAKGRSSKQLGCTDG